MATYPYTPAPGGLIAAVTQLRKSFPGIVDAAYLKRNKVATANESYVIAVLKFLNLIDDEGKRIEANTGYFFGSDDAFKSGLEDTLRDAYAPLIQEKGGDAAFTAEKEDLTHWFREADKTTELVGQRQATTFQVLAGLAGHGELPAVRAGTSRAKPASGATPAKKTPAKKADPAPKINPPNNPSGGGAGGGKNGQEVGVTVRIEVNLPPDGDAETYDAIFASIKKHLMS